MTQPASLPSQADVVIIGGGMAGLSCAASLARKGITDVVLLEAQTLAHARASSYGETRMFREMYSDPVLCRLAQEANRLWREEETHAGEQLRETHGLLFYGESWDEETIEGSIPGARRVMDDQDIPYEALDADQIAARFPLKPKAGFTGLFEPTAGAVRSDRVDRPLDPNRPRRWPKDDRALPRGRPRSGWWRRHPGQRRAHCRRAAGGRLRHLEPAVAGSPRPGTETGGMADALGPLHRRPGAG